MNIIQAKKTKQTKTNERKKKLRVFFRNEKKICDLQWKYHACIYTIIKENENEPKKKNLHKFTYFFLPTMFLWLLNVWWWWWWWWLHTFDSISLGNKKKKKKEMYSSSHTPSPSSSEFFSWKIFFYGCGWCEWWWKWDDLICNNIHPCLLFVCLFKHPKPKSQYDAFNQASKHHLQASNNNNNTRVPRIFFFSHNLASFLSA